MFAKRELKYFWVTLAVAQSELVVLHCQLDDSLLVDAALKCLLVQRAPAKPLEVLCLQLGQEVARLVGHKAHDLVRIRELHHASVRKILAASWEDVDSRHTCRTLLF